MPKATSLPQVPESSESEKDANGNKNFLKGMQCPECGHCRYFHVAVTISTSLEIYDKGYSRDFTTVKHTVDYTDESTAECGNCRHVSTVGGFKAGYVDELGEKKPQGEQDVKDKEPSLRP